MSKGGYIQVGEDDVEFLEGDEGGGGVGEQGEGL